MGDDMDINARLEKLERENRRMKKIGIVTVVFASVLFISGQAKTNKVIEANEFHLVDGAGKVRGTFVTNNDGQTLLRLSDSTGQVVANFGTGTQGSSLFLGSTNSKQQIVFVNPGIKGIPTLQMSGSGGNLEVTLDRDSGGPSLTIEDSDGYSSALGRSDLVLTKTGKKEQTPAASLVLFDKDKKVLWSAP
jgi:hypothetical protein